MTWLWLLEALVWVACVSLLLGCCVFGVIACVEARDWWRARRAARRPMCACGAWTADWEWMELAGWRHSGALCCPVAEVVR